MCFISSGGNSNKSDENINETNSNTAAYSDVSGEIASNTVNASGRSTVNMRTTDRGAVEKSFLFATEAMRSASSVNASALKAVKDQAGVFSRKLSDFAEVASANNDERISSTTRWAVGAVAVLGAVAAWRAKK